MRSKNKIINSWQVNAREWIALIENDGIESRKITNPAILKTIVKHQPKKILDLGCGEGWLTSMLFKKGLQAYGADAINDFILHAGKSKEGVFFQLSYQEISAGAKIPHHPFDAVVFNFSLYEKAETADLLKQIQTQLSNKGLIFIQTLHPNTLIKSDLKYQSQWIDNAWKGLPGSFSSPHPWYCRTLEDWLNIFNTCKLELLSIREPVDNQERLPVSIIFTLRKGTYDE